jgi:N-ethylmaleimide reductase
MAPLTRNRASAGQVPNDLMREYYRQRANPATGAGLIITEATQISPMGQGYLDTPGIHSPAQVAAWRRITDAVHAERRQDRDPAVACGAHLAQCRCCRAARRRCRPPRPAKGKTFIAGGFADCSAPRALRTDEIPARRRLPHAARCAMDAGFDGVEVHGANGYLIEQFLRDSINDRSDAYGGTVENRTRLLLEVMQAITQEIGGGRTGIRLSPVTPSNDAGPTATPQALMAHAVAQLAPLKLAYLHLIEGQTGGPRDVAPFDYAALRRLTSSAWMVNNGYTRQMSLDAVAGGAADLVAFGKAFIANPDLGLRLREDAALNPLDAARLYGGDAQGYTDYPMLNAAVA